MAVRPAEASPTRLARRPSAAATAPTGRNGRPTAKRAPATDRNRAPRVRTSGRAADLADKVTSRRTVFALGCWLLVAGLVVAQLVRLQLTPSPRFVSASTRQRLREEVLLADRGELLDRFGEVLALDAPTLDVIADPDAIARAEKTEITARVLAPILGVSEQEILTKLRKSGKYAVLTRNRADDVRTPVLAAMTANGLVGITVHNEPTRTYPGGDLARSVIGKARRDIPQGKDQEDLYGISGLELQLDQGLRGTPGVLRSERNPKRQVISAGLTQRVPAVRGTSYVLTLDRKLQHEVEQKLIDAVSLTGARSGVVLVSDPATGDVIVSANVLAPNDGSPVRVASYNIAATERFEPGSVMKPLTIGAALDEGVTTADQRWFVPDALQVADHKFSDDVAHPDESLTPSEILQHSSNVGTIRIAQRLGRANLTKYLDKVGFGRRTEVDFPDEVRGLVPGGSEWSGTSIGAVPIGQEVGVSGLQLLALYNTIANDGVRVPLRMVRGTVDGQSNRVDQPVAPGTRVFTSQTAQTLRNMLTEVVDKGLATKAALTGFSVAGKTGTAQVARTGGRGYAEGRYVADFAGFFPASHPRVSIVIVLFEPTPYYGSKVAAPLFADVARAVAVRYRLTPDRVAPGESVVVEAPYGYDSADTRREILAARAHVAVAPAVSSAPASAAVPGASTSTTKPRAGGRSAGSSSAGSSSAGSSSAVVAPAEAGPSEAVRSEGTDVAPSAADGPSPAEAPRVTTPQRPAARPSTRPRVTPRSAEPTAATQPSASTSDESSPGAVAVRATADLPAPSGEAGSGDGSDPVAATVSAESP